jgi:hypothetical protein
MLAEGIATEQIAKTSIHDVAAPHRRRGPEPTESSVGGPGRIRRLHRRRPDQIRIGWADEDVTVIRGGDRIPQKRSRKRRDHRVLAKRKTPTQGGRGSFIPLGGEC